LIAGHRTKFQGHLQAVKSFFDFRTWKNDSDGDLSIVEGRYAGMRMEPSSCLLPTSFAK
jgi:hypothetical protein